MPDIVSCGDLVTHYRGKPIFWAGHLCEGTQFVPDDPGTFVFWTRCGRHDILRARQSRASR
jgi:hypothetical protein